MTEDYVQRELLDLVADLPMNTRGKIARAERKRRRLLIAQSQGLTELEPNGHLIFPHKYLRQYEALKLHDPIAAETFYNQCLYDPRPKAVDPFAREKKILSRIGEEVKPLRRRI